MKTGGRQGGKDKSYTSIRPLVPNLGVGTPSRGDKINLRGCKRIYRIEKQKNFRFLFIFSGFPLYFYAVLAAWLYGWQCRSHGQSTVSLQTEISKLLLNGLP